MDSELFISSAKIPYYQWVSNAEVRKALSRQEMQEVKVLEVEEEVTFNFFLRIYLCKC